MAFFFRLLRFLVPLREAFLVFFLAGLGLEKAGPPGGSKENRWARSPGLGLELCKPFPYNRF